VYESVTHTAAVNVFGAFKNEDMLSERTTDNKEGNKEEEKEREKTQKSK
jgi:hypothetical protein